LFKLTFYEAVALHLAADTHNDVYIHIYMHIYAYVCRGVGLSHRSI